MLASFIVAPVVVPAVSFSLARVARELVRVEREARRVAEAIEEVVVRSR